MQNKKYQIIYADPPYEYRNKSTGGSMNSGSNAKYSVMTIDDICQLPVSDLEDDICACFLWVTTPLLPDGFKILKEWGFEYKTAIYWRKVMSLGMGYWFRGQVEVCLLGVTKKVRAFRCQRANFIQSKVREHSRKPDEMYEIIENLQLEPKIELFARSKREGWDTWGNEVESDIELIPERSK